MNLRACGSLVEDGVETLFCFVRLFQHVIMGNDGSSGLVIMMAYTTMSEQYCWSGRVRGSSVQQTARNPGIVLVRLCPGASIDAVRSVNLLPKTVRACETGCQLRLKNCHVNHGENSSDVQLPNRYPLQIATSLEWSSGKIFMNRLRCATLTVAPVEDGVRQISFTRDFSDSRYTFELCGWMCIIS